MSRKKKIPAPQKRLTIDNNTIKEIHSAYPPQESVTGKSYKARLDYTTTEIDFFEEQTVKKLIKKHGLAPIGFYDLLRIEMANSNGYGLCKNTEEFKIFIYSLDVKYNIDKETANKYINTLTEYNLLLTIKDEETGEEYYTTLQSIWNYEYRLYYRYTNREKQRNYRNQKEKDKTDNKETKPETNSTDNFPLPESLFTDDNSNDFSDFDFGDLPFDN